MHSGLGMTDEECVLLGADASGLMASTEDFRAGTMALPEEADTSLGGT